MTNDTPQDRTRDAREWARSHNETDIHVVNQELLAKLFNKLLTKADLDALSDKISASPKEFFELVRTLLEQNSERTKRMKVELELETYRDQVAEQKRKMKEALKQPDTKKGLSPEVLQQIEEAMANL